MLALLGCLFVGTIGTQGCAQAQTSTIGITSNNQAATSDYERATQLETSGDLAAAENAYASLEASHPADPLAGASRLNRGRLRLANGRYEDARQLFTSLRQSPDSRLAQRATYYEGVALAFLGRAPEAVAILAPAVSAIADPEDAKIAYRALVSSYLSLGQRVDAVLALNDFLALRVLSHAEAEEASDALRGHIAHLDDEALQLVVARASQSSTAWPLAARAALQKALEAGQMSRVRTIARQLDDAGHRIDADLQAMLVQADREGRVNPNVVGAILPLTGSGREVGEQALRGLMLAAASVPRMQLSFRDSHGDPEEAARAVDELVREHQVGAIIGPLNCREARAAAVRAEVHGIALLSLCPDAQVASSHPHVYRLAPSLREELDALVGAAAERGVTSIAILAGAHSYGESAKSIVRELSTARGLRIAVELVLPAGTTDFRSVALGLAATSFDGLVLLDNSTALEVLVPTLASAGYWSDATTVPRGGRHVTYLLPSVAMSSRLLANANRYVQGALVAAAYPSAFDSAAPRPFPIEYHAQFGRNPEFAAAVTYDAFRFLVSVTGSGEAQTYSDLHALLGRVRTPTETVFEGLTLERRPVRPVAVWQVQGRLGIEVTTDAANHRRVAP